MVKSVLVSKSCKSSEGELTERSKVDQEGSSLDICGVSKCIRIRKIVL